ncbi:MAG TPA: S53 family peptidase [Terracidiphilus sp.]|nr:S53 family peptidase [Terracidiphilus sp.]
MAKSPRVKAARFAEQARVLLTGSEKAAAENAVHVKATPDKAKVTVSLILKRKEPLKINKRGGRANGPVRVSRTEYKRRHTADPAALKLVSAFAKEFNLKVEDDPTSATRRTVQLTGAAADIRKAFAVELDQKTIDGVEYRVREGGIHLPETLAGSVLAVLGLDNRPQAQPHFRVKKLEAEAAHAEAEAAGPSSYTPPQVAQAYQWPAGASAAGQTIGIIELGGGYRQSDLTAYFKSLGMAAPAISAVSVDRGKNAPSTASGPDGEVMLDIEVAAAVAPGAKIVVYFTPNTDQGFTDAITTAVHDETNKPSVISISWGGPESRWTPQAMAALDAACQSAAALGVTITVAAGDNGSTDGGTGNNVDFPASSPHVLACGGTKLNANGSTIVSEVVWNELAVQDGATGGGVSTAFALPSWQAASNVPAASTSTGGRGVPDVAGDADPNTGYTIRVDGQTTVIGGTSAVAPLWAGLIAVANQQLGTQVGFIQPAIYATKAAAAFNDITEGNNGAFSAGPGWDACTGLGSPIASKLIPLLAAAGTTPTPTPTPAPPPPPPPPPGKKKRKKKKAAQVKPVEKKASKKAAGKKAEKKSKGKKTAAKKKKR